MPELKSTTTISVKMRAQDPDQAYLEWHHNDPSPMVVIGPSEDGTGYTEIRLSDLLEFIGLIPGWAKAEAYEELTASKNRAQVQGTAPSSE